jgi:hypothetical protein
MNPTVARSAAFFALRSVSAAVPFGHTLFESHPALSASLFLPIACTASAVPRPSPATPAHPTITPRVRTEPPLEVGVEASAETCAGVVAGALGPAGEGGPTDPGAATGLENCGGSSRRRCRAQ